ncbi:MAG: DUF2933 domain-containing protein [Armatimonadota bacterium]|nr:DUF2933 domain-containing protein [Armatimonadota bacterium]
MGLRTRIALSVFLAIAAFFLLTKHWEHVWPLLPFLFLLACPLMHLFHHHGHGGHDKGQDTPTDPTQTARGVSQEGHH